MSSPDRGKGGGGVGSLCDKKYAYNKTFIDIFIFSICCLLLKVVLDAVFINRAASICHHLPNLEVERLRDFLLQKKRFYA